MLPLSHPGSNIQYLVQAHSIWNKAGLGYFQKRVYAQISATAVHSHRRLIEIDSRQPYDESKAHSKTDSPAKHVVACRAVWCAYSLCGTSVPRAKSIVSNIFTV